MLIGWPRAAKPKSIANAMSSCLKLLSFLLCLAAGAKDFSNTLASKQCFNTGGTELVNDVKDGVKVFEMFTIVSSVGSLMLLPLSMQWGGQLVAGSPYARVS